MRSAIGLAAVLAIGLALSAPLRATAAETAPAENAGGRYLNQVMATSEPHKKTLVALMRGRRGLPEWMRSIVTSAQYVTGTSRIITLPEGTFELFGACNPRDCPSSHVRILFSLDGTTAWVRLEDPKFGEQLLGLPSAGQMQVLRAPGI